MPKVEKYITESLGAEVLAISSNQPQTYYVAAASLSEFKLKKILIDKIKENKSMNKSDIQKNLYNTLIKSYNSDKDLFASYGDVVTLKRGRDNQDKDEEPSTGSNRGTKSQPKSSGKSAQEEEHGPRVDDLKIQLYMFREGDFKRLHLQHIEDMLLLLVQDRVEDIQLALKATRRRLFSQDRSYHSFSDSTLNMLHRSPMILLLGYSDGVPAKEENEAKDQAKELEDLRRRPSAVCYKSDHMISSYDCSHHTGKQPLQAKRLRLRSLSIGFLQVVSRACEVNSDKEDTSLNQTSTNQRDGCDSRILLHTTITAMKIPYH
ncbi:hypothetical protein Tco_0614874 [Tanacetum coccineum]